VKLALVWALVLVCAPGARAESSFSLNLLGERIDAGDARAVALGGTVQLLDDSLGVLQLNPAMLSYASRVTFGAGQFFAADANKSSLGDEKDVTTKFTSFSFAFPVLRLFTVGLSYRGRYDPNSEFTTYKTSSAGEAYREEFVRQGGLNSYQLGVARDVGRFVKVGGYVSVENGSVENRWNTIFSASDQAPAYNIQDRTLSGSGWGLGLVLRPMRQVMVGVTYEGEIDYDVEVVERYTNSAAEGSYDESMTLPARWTAAAHWHSEEFAVYAGASIRDFEQFEGLAFPRERLYREEVASLGVEYLRGFGLFGRRFPVRVSMTFERLPYDYPEGERVQRLVAGLGTGLLFSDGRGKIDVALQAGRVGSKDSNGLQTNLLRLYVGVSGSEVWKRKRESAY
jgi:hypothetical protein